MKQFRVGEHYDEVFMAMDQKEIKDNLDGICYGKEEGSYTKNLTESELANKKSRLAEVSIKLSEIDDLKKKYMDEIKQLLLEPKAEHGILLGTIKHKTERAEGMLWLVDDQDEGMMYSFDVNGICVDARFLNPSEKQGKIRMLNKNKSVE